MTEGHGGEGQAGTASFFGAVVQIVLLDIVFSLDSVITAVGMADHLQVMIAAVVIAILVMLVAADPTARFVNRHPTVKMLALSFLLLVGMALMADAAHCPHPARLPLRGDRLLGGGGGAEPDGGRGPATAARGRQPPAARLSGAARYAVARSCLDVTRVTCGKSTRRTGRPDGVQRAASGAPRSCA